MILPPPIEQWTVLQRHAAYSLLLDARSALTSPGKVPIVERRELLRRLREATKERDE